MLPNNNNNNINNNDNFENNVNVNNDCTINDSNNFYIYIKKIHRTLLF